MPPGTGEYRGRVAGRGRHFLYPGGGRSGEAARRLADARVLARWQEFVGTGQLLKRLEEARLVAWGTASPPRFAVNPRHRNGQRSDRVRTGQPVGGLASDAARRADRAWSQTRARPGADGRRRPGHPPTSMSAQPHFRAGVAGRPAGDDPAPRPTNADRAGDGLRAQRHIPGAHGRGSRPPAFPAAPRSNRRGQRFWVQAA